MKFKIKGRYYHLLMKYHILPIGFAEVVSQPYGMPEDYKLIINGSKLKGKVALVTGAHKGIGFHIAFRLLKEGAKVIITGRNEESLKRTIGIFDTPNVKYLVWDIADGKVKDHFDEAIRLFGNIDILVNNAGVNKIKGVSMSFEDATLDYIHAMNDINVLGTVQMCEEFICRTSSGTILNVISNTAVRAATGIYWMSKWAIYDYTKGLSKKFNNSLCKITVNGICPGPTMTDMMFDKNSPFSTVYYPAMANKRIGLPEEIAELAFLQILAGLNGQNGEITVCDGGESLI